MVKIFQYDGDWREVWEDADRGGSFKDAQRCVEAAASCMPHEIIAMGHKSIADGVRRYFAVRLHCGTTNLFYTDSHD